MSKIVKIDNKYYDFGTKNESFLLTCSELKMLGIRNWYMPLEVKFPNTNVQDLDPFNENLSREDIAKIILESQHNVWYWLREVCRIPVRGVGNLPVTLHRSSCAATWSYTKNIDFMLDQPRQTWKTTHILALEVHAFLFLLRNCEVPFVHMKEKTCLRNAEIFRDYVNALPKYMNPWSNDKKPPGLKSLRYEKHGVTIKLIASAESETKANDQLRGATLFSGFFDEWEFTDYIDYILSGANPAIISARDIVRSNGGRSCIMFASTPGDMETNTGKAAQKMIDQTVPFTENMYDMTDDEINNIFEGYLDETTNQMVKPPRRLYIKFTYKQLRKTEEWVDEQYAEAVATDKISEYKRGVLQLRFRGDNGSLFNQADIDYIQHNMKEPDHVMFLMKKYQLCIYYHEIKHPDINAEQPFFDIQLPYMVGIDVASGSGGDSTTFIIVHPYTLQVVGEISSPYMGFTDLVKMITIIHRMLPACLFIPETNNLGKALADVFQDNPIMARIYHDPKLDITKNATVKEDPETEMKRRASEKRYIGTTVTPKIRNQMFALLIRHVSEYRELLTTKYLATDIINLVRTKSGKIEAGSGSHDDMVMAYNHVLYVLYYGHDLTRFGIDKNLCTFEMTKQIVDAYAHEVDENTVNNMLPYDTPTMYEQQALDALTSNTPTYAVENGVDAYGYKPSDYREFNSGFTDYATRTHQYAQNNTAAQDEIFLSGSDYMAFDSMNFG